MSTDRIQQLEALLLAVREWFAAEQDYPLPNQESAKTVAKALTRIDLALVKVCVALAALDATGKEGE